MSEFRVFLSTVSSEFGQARDTLTASLRSRDLLLRVQSDVVAGNYAGPARSMGKSEAQIDAVLAALRAEVGLDQA